MYYPNLGNSIGTHRGRRAEAAVAVAAPVVRVFRRCCRKRQTTRRWPEWAAAARRRRCCTVHRGVDGGDGVGGATAVAAAAAAAAEDGDRPTNRAAACWTAPSEARTTDAEPLAAAETAPVPMTRAVV